MKDPNILQLIKSRKDHYTPQQAKIASYLLGNYEKVAFLTATQLAKEIGVSQPTVIRFAQSLGFPKFNLFLAAFQELLTAELTSADRFNLSLVGGPSTSEGSSNIIIREIRTLTAFARDFPQEAFDRAVSMIAKSKNIYVLGTRGSASLAQYFRYFLNKVKRNVIAVTRGSTNEYDTLLHLKPEDLVVAIAFPRYPRETIELVRFCRQRGATIVGITDKINSPLYALSELALIIPVTFSTIFDSYCSAMCLFNMMVTEVGRANKEESAAMMREFEAMARDLEIFIREKRIKKHASDKNLPGNNQKRL
ncbi:MAG: MurR/RpiR family transcriptional regulator [Deltaproteobacteria bacterium]|nr:MurR/RpiR family transcriptional regulator [Deltaproteobacteria bacterium]MBW2017521.1 MurR/RpiR family transcriptional regulator [Deltaproteobacteria bacterium]MBW2130234.1 MurR/RpiR family transcriptional regulator [Deltaproteobacteria bacterium]MBW2304775.1 MurR/RpiR family transcriptional regulator [Deltaproteobacteria bacterium]